MVSTVAVNVRELADDVYYYEFDVSTSYQGLLLNKDDSMVVTPEGEQKNKDPLEPAPFGRRYGIIPHFQHKIRKHNQF